MAKLGDRAYSRYALDALELLGRSIRLARLERKMTSEDLAERAGISRGLLHRIERGDPGASVGAVLEAAAVAGVPLFDAEGAELSLRARQAGERLALLPSSVRYGKPPVRDDF